MNPRTNRSRRQVVLLIFAAGILAAGSLAGCGGTNGGGNGGAGTATVDTVAVETLLEPLDPAARNEEPAFTVLRGGSGTAREVLSRDGQGGWYAATGGADGVAWLFVEETLYRRAGTGSGAAWWAVRERRCEKTWGRAGILAGQERVDLKEMLGTKDGASAKVLGEVEMSAFLVEDAGILAGQEGTVRGRRYELAGGGELHTDGSTRYELRTRKGEQTWATVRITVRDTLTLWPPVVSGVVDCSGTVIERAESGE